MMHRRSTVKRRALLACGVGIILAATHAQAIFIVNQPWARPAARGGSTEVYMDLTSTEGVMLIAVATDAAQAVFILQPGKAVKPTESVALKPGTLVALKPGSYRISLQRLARTLKLGDRVTLTLTIRDADGAEQQIPVNAEVRLRSPIEDELAHKHRH
ncbi:MAG: copper chaperone PCu(A)C [Betaproteobacteria bacterium]|nr:MAG: copper chaperone PCu(A)C [Betaproteobacteria bacterium]